jgi:hypothetical protein
MRCRMFFWWSPKRRSVESNNSRTMSDAVTRATPDTSEMVRDLFGAGSCEKCRGTGKCEECLGSGVNIHLNQDEPKCGRCSGTGKCSKCGGLGSPLGHWGEHRPV